MSTPPNTPPARALGFIPQDPSDKDIQFAGVDVLPGATGDIDMRKWCSPVDDQGPINACVGNATCSAMEMLRIKQRLPHLDMSRLFTYYNARAMRGDQSRDIGSVIRFAFSSLQKLGTCSEAFWPYNTAKVLSKPTLLAFRNAYSARIKDYQLITGTGQARIDACNNALLGGYPVVFGINVSESFMYPGATDTPKITGQYVGAHAMMLCGTLKAKRLFIVRNSWGRTWGSMGGYCYMPWSYFDEHRAADIWTCRETPKVSG